MNTYGLIEPIAKVAQQIHEEDPLSEWGVTTRSADGEWCVLYSVELGISTELYMKDSRVMAKPSFRALGFSGEIAGMELCMPNSHFQRVIMQLETIKWFLPKDNINDHYHNVALEYMKKEREKRRASRIPK